MAPCPAHGRNPNDSRTGPRAVALALRAGAQGSPVAPLAVAVAAGASVVLPTALALVLALVARPASAVQSPAPQTHPEAREAISKLRSPFCPGLMLEVCPTANAQALRDSIDGDARQGLTADSLVEKVVATYGEEYRAFPRRTGAGLLAWVMPPAALLLGLGLVIVALRRLRAPTDALGSAGGAEALTIDEQARLEAALAELEAEDEEDA